MKKSILLILFIISCNKNNDQKMDVTIKYYSSFVGYNHPVKLIDELNEKQKNEKECYYVGTFDNNRLIKVEKILNNETAFIYYYSYDKNGNLLKFNLNKSF